MININLTKAKTIAHNMRRSARAAEFAPHDEVITKRIPGIIEPDVEAARAEIRVKYAAMQTDIDHASTPEELKAALGVI